MAEVGVDLTEEFPKPLTDEFVAGCGCRDHDGLRRRLPDLSRQAIRGLGARGPGQEKDLETVRAIRGQIEVRVRRLLGELVAGRETGG